MEKDKNKNGSSDMDSMRLHKPNAKYWAYSYTEHGVVELSQCTPFYFIEAFL
jgi:hypothetical protein